MADKTTNLKVVFQTEGLQNLRGLSSGLSKLNKGAKGAGISVRGLIKELKQKERTEVKSINNTRALSNGYRELASCLYELDNDLVPLIVCVAAFFCFCKLTNNFLLELVDRRELSFNFFKLDVNPRSLSTPSSCNKNFSFVSLLATIISYPSALVSMPRIPLLVFLQT